MTRAQRSRRRTERAVAWIAAGALVASAAACGGTDAEPGRDPAVARGEKIYRNICIVCHNADPNLDGVQGPANADATRELLEYKVLRGEYPPGYTPKRDSHQMPVFAYLEPNIDDIAAFLASRRK